MISLKPLATRIRLFSTAAVLGAAVSFGALSQAQSPAAAPAAPSAQPGQVTATTVFVDAQAGSRKEGSAKRINKSHADMEAKGWRFQDLEPYTENGDLVGFFITYVK
jgi:hypothetical protein